MTKTEHYQLNQWDAADQVKRTDFNEDNAKLDAALAGLSSSKADSTSVNAALAELRATDATKADSASVDSQVAALTARIAALESRVDVAAGTYTGDGKTSKYISVGFVPRAVLVEHDYGCRGTNRASSISGGLAVTGSPLYGSANGWTVNAVRISGSGFYVSGETGSSMNYSGQKYHYVAFR